MWNDEVKKKKMQKREMKTFSQRNYYDKNYSRKIVVNSMGSCSAYQKEKNVKL